MTVATDLSRRSFLVSSTVAAGGFALGFQLPTGDAAAAVSIPEVNAWVVDQARRHGRRPRRPGRDGPRHADRPRPARRRRAGVRLGQGDHRVPDTRPERRPPAGVGQLPDGRQPRRSRQPRLHAQGRRRRPHDDVAGGRQPMGRAGHLAARSRRASSVRGNRSTTYGKVAADAAQAAGRRPTSR